MQVPDKLRLEATCDPTSWSIPDVEAAKAGKLPTFSIVANSGNPMDIEGFPDPIIVDLIGVRFASKKLPVIMDHDSTKRIGHTTSLQDGAKDIRVEGVVSSSMGVAQGFVQDAKNGFPFQASIGANVESAIHVDEGASIQVNGKNHKGPLIVAQRTSIYEISVTVLGADSKTSVRVAAKRRSSMKEEFKKYLEARHLDPDKLDEKVIEAMQKDFDAAEKLKAAAVDAALNKGKTGSFDDSKSDGSNKNSNGDADLKASRKREAEEIERIEALRAICNHTDYEKVDPKLRAQYLRSAITEPWDKNALEVHLLKARKPIGPGGNMRTIHKDVVPGRALSCAVARLSGIREEAIKGNSGRKYGISAWYTEKERLEADKFRDIGLQQLMDMTIEAAGMHCSSRRGGKEHIRLTLEADKKLRAAEGFSTLTVSNILEDSANKTLLAAYESQNMVWREFCAVRSLNDFKTHGFYRLQTSGGYQKVGNQGELKHGQFSDDKYTVKADTYGMLLTLGRQDMKNDDLNAFAQIPSQIGRLAALALESAAFEALLTNTGAHFGTGNGNIKTGTGSAMAVASLTAALAVFRNFVDFDGKPVLNNPIKILCGSALEATADNLYNEQNVTWLTSEALTTGGAKTQHLPRNPHKGKYRPVVSPYCNNTAITRMSGAAISANQSDTKWWLFGDPEVVPCFFMGFVDGNQAPVIEFADTDFNTLGLQYRGYSDFGIGYGDPKGGVQNDGA